MSLQKKLFYLSGTVFLISCSQSEPLKVYKWSHLEKSKSPSVVYRSEFKQGDSYVQQSDETIEYAHQKIKSAQVEGAFLQKIYNENGDLIYLIGSVLDENLDHLLPVVDKLETEKYVLLERMKIKNKELKNASYVFDPQIVIEPNGGDPQALLAISYFNERGTAAYKMKVTPAGIVSSIERVGSSFHDGYGVVYPTGPKTSELSEIILKNLLGDGTLSSSKVSVVPAEGEKAVNTDHDFKYEPGDSRFNQVQAFFYIDKALDWFKGVLGVNLPFKVQAETHVGGLGKTNTFFYYQGKIRLGDGDGIAYRNIPQDPSIVIHETCHALVDALSHLPFNGEGGSINEGFSDFITASMLNNPNLGETAYLQGPYKRTVANDFKASDKNGGLYHDSLIVSGTLWDIRKSLGVEKANNLAVRSLSRMGPTGNFSSFKSVIELTAKEVYETEDQIKVSQILAHRGW